VARYIESVRAPRELRDRIAAHFVAFSSGRHAASRIWRETARAGWFRAITAAACILLVFALVYVVLLAPPATLNAAAVRQHIAVVRDQVPAFMYTKDAARARDLALFKFGHKPSIPHLGDGDFELVGAGPAEIELKDVGHFVFRYKAATVSMFVFSGLSLDEVAGKDVETRRGLAKLDAQRGLSLLAWRGGGFTYILVSQLPGQDLVGIVGVPPSAE